MKKITILLLLTVLTNILGALQLALADEIRDVKPPLALPGNYLIWIVPLVILTVLLIGWLIWCFFKRKPSLRKVDELPRAAWEVAYERLRLLRLEKLPVLGRIKEYYTKLSDIVRQYIEARFEIRAPEMTTEEFLYSLKFSERLSAQQKEALQQFLTCCDMVKFARYGSSEQEMEKSFILAERLIDETKQDVKKEG